MASFSPFGRRIPAALSPFSNRNLLPATPIDRCTPNAICTPSVLYGSYSPWAQQTPSPSPVHQQPSFFPEESTTGRAIPSDLTGGSNAGLPAPAAMPPSPSTAACPPLPLRKRQCPEPPPVAQLSQDDLIPWSGSSPDVASPKTTQDKETPPAAEDAISKEFVRKICAPFFNEMVDAVQQALQAQMGTSSVEADLVARARRSFEAADPYACLAQALRSRSLTSNGPNTSEASEEGGPCSQSPSPVPPSPPTASSPGTVDTPPQTLQRNEARRCTMVCHHWKSKGWCRMGDDCKFMHPENKKGVGSGSSTRRSRNFGSVSTGASSSSTAGTGARGGSSDGEPAPAVAAPVRPPNWPGQQEGFFSAPMPAVAPMGYPVQACPQAAFWFFQPSP